MEADDYEAWSFYCHNARPFVQQYGLMPRLLDEHGLEGSSRRMFLERLCLIHEKLLSARAGERPDDGSTLYAEDPT